jgi:hypothetical protein
MFKYTNDTLINIYRKTNHFGYVAMLLSILLITIYFITSYNDPHYIYTTDVESDYYYNSLLINDGDSPSSYHHPGYLVQLLGSTVHLLLEDENNYNDFFNLARFYGVIAILGAFLVTFYLFREYLHTLGFFTIVGVYLSWPNTIEVFSYFSPNLFVLPVLLITISFLWKIFSSNENPWFNIIFITLVTITLSIKLVILPAILLILIIFYIDIGRRNSMSKMLITVSLSIPYMFFLFLTISNLSLLEFVNLLIPIIRNMMPGGVSKIDISIVLEKLMLAKWLIVVFLLAIILFGFSLIKIRSFNIEMKSKYWSKMLLLLSMMVAVIYYMSLDMVVGGVSIESEFHYAIPVAPMLPFYFLFFYDVFSGSRIEDNSVLNTSMITSLFIIILIVNVAAWTVMFQEKSNFQAKAVKRLNDASSIFESFYNGEIPGRVALAGGLDLDKSMFHMVGDAEYSGGKYIERVSSDFSNYSLFLPENIPFIKKIDIDYYHKLKERITNIVCHGKIDLIRENQGLKATIVGYLGGLFPEKICNQLVGLFTTANKPRRLGKSNKIFPGKDGGDQIKGAVFPKNIFINKSVSDDVVINELNKIYPVEKWEDHEISGNWYRFILLK